MRRIENSEIRAKVPVTVLRLSRQLKGSLNDLRASQAANPLSNRSQGLPFLSVDGAVGGNHARGLLYSSLKPIQCRKLYRIRHATDQLAALASMLVTCTTGIEAR